MINLSFTPMMIAAACDSLQCFDIFIECKRFDRATIDEISL